MHCTHPSGDPHARAVPVHGAARTVLRAVLAPSRAAAWRTDVAHGRTATTVAVKPSLRSSRRCDERERTGSRERQNGFEQGEGYVPFGACGHQSTSHAVTSAGGQTWAGPSDPDSRALRKKSIYGLDNIMCEAQACLDSFFSFKAFFRRSDYRNQYNFKNKCGHKTRGPLFRYGGLPILNRNMNHHPAIKVIPTKQWHSTTTITRASGSHTRTAL